MRSLLGPLAATLLACAASTSPDVAEHPVTVASVKMDPRTSTPVVLLEESGGKQRVLPIWIGRYEAESIALGMEKINVPRPNTHDLIVNLLEGIEARLSRVVITELKASTYYAVIDLEVGGRKVTIDSRPSDAIAVAIRTGTPLFATEKVLQRREPISEPPQPLEILWDEERKRELLSH